MKTRQIAVWFLGGAIAGIAVTGTWIGWETVSLGVYRWQTLITGLLALGAAIWAGRTVFQQLDQMRRQSAATAVGTYSSIAQRMEEEVTRLESTDKAIDICQIWLGILRYEAPQRTADVDELRDELFKKARALEIELQYHQKNRSRHSRSNSVNDARVRFINQIEIAFGLFDTLALDYNQISTWDDEITGPDLSPEQREDCFNRCQIALSECTASLLIFKAALMGGIFDTWRMVRGLEDAVIDERGKFST